MNLLRRILARLAAWLHPLPDVSAPEAHAAMRELRRALENQIERDEARTKGKRARKRKGGGRG